MVQIFSEAQKYFYIVYSDELPGSKRKVCNPQENLLIHEPERRHLVKKKPLVFKVKTFALT